MKADLLRNLKKNTELLILVLTLEKPLTRLKDLAKELGVTVQAVSQYVSGMRKEGLLSEREGVLRPTRKGMQMLQEHFVELKEEIDSVLRRISVVDSCVAFAGARIRKGERVGLVMERGRLVAYPGGSAASTGMALEAASAGDDVLIGQLEGIVDMDLGNLVIIEVPSEFEGGAKKAGTRRARDVLRSRTDALLVAGDIAGSALLSRLGHPTHVTHASVESAMSALSKGVDVVFFGARDSIDRILEEIDNLKKETGYEIRWRTVKA